MYALRCAAGCLLQPVGGRQAERVAHLCDSKKLNQWPFLAERDFILETDFLVELPGLRLRAYQ